MKNMNTLKINLLIAVWFAVMLFVAMIATSCSTSSHSCDAYGKIKTLENNNTSSK